MNALIQYCNDNKIDAILTSYDFRQAFDSCEWPAMIKILQSYGFQYTFINMVMTCFRNFETRILNNGFTTKSITVTRGNKQGCPLSALIFDLIEIIALKLRQNPDIQGILINDVTKLLSQFADDLWMVTKYDEKCFQTQIALFKSFHLFTGLSINYDKTEIMRIGSLAHTNARFYSSLLIKWSDGPIKILGIWVGNNIPTVTKYNYQLAVKKAEQIMQCWSNRILTLYGKILIVNVLVQSQFIYKLRCLPSPTKEIYKKMRKLITKYLWSGGRVQISYNKLMRNYALGGLKLFDLETKNQVLKANKLVQYSLCDDPVIRAIFEHCIPMPHDLILKLNLNSKDAKKLTKYSFFQDIITSWTSINYNYPPLNANELEDQIIWYNSNVKTNNECMYNAKLKQAQIVSVKQFYNSITKQWLSFTEFTTKYGNIRGYDFIQHYTIINAFPKEWLRIMGFKGTGGRDTILVKITKAKYKTTGILYDEIMSKRIPIDNAQTKWEVILDREFSNSTWEKIIMYIYHVTNCTKLRWFQFRQINNTITTNLLRHKWDKEISPLCYYCQIEDEMIIHLFVHCNVVKKKVWTPLTRWLHHHCFLNFEVNPYHILLLRYNDSCRDLVNTIILIAKQYIYATKCTAKILNFKELMYKVNLYRTVEEVTAIKNNKYAYHELKWSLYDRV